MSDHTNKRGEPRGISKEQLREEIAAVVAPHRAIVEFFDYDAKVRVRVESQAGQTLTRQRFDNVDDLLRQDSVRFDCLDALADAAFSKAGVGDPISRQRS